MSADVSIVSRLGHETISFTGQASIHRSDPHDDGGVQVIDTEISALSLTGAGEQGTITASLWGGATSVGEIRSLSDGAFPASSFFDVYLDVVIPASGTRTVPPFHVHNAVPVHLVATPDLGSWPPDSAQYEMQFVAPPPATATPGPQPPADTPDCSDGIRLVPQFPAEICMKQVSVKISACPECTPEPTTTATDTRTPTRTPTSTRTPTDTPTATSNGTETATITPTPTGSATVPPTKTQSPTKTATGSPPAPTETETPSPTPSATPTATTTPAPPSATPPPTSTPTFTPTPTPGANGDASCNGHTDAADALLILQFEVQLLDVIACEPEADVNRDGHIDALDAALILQFVAGLVEHLPV